MAIPGRAGDRKHRDFRDSEDLGQGRVAVKPERGGTRRGGCRSVGEPGVERGGAALEPGRVKPAGRQRDVFRGGACGEDEALAGAIVQRMHGGAGKGIERQADAQLSAVQFGDIRGPVENQPDPLKREEVVAREREDEAGGEALPVGAAIQERHHQKRRGEREKREEAGPEERLRFGDELLFGVSEDSHEASSTADCGCLGAAFGHLA